MTRFTALTLSVVLVIGTAAAAEYADTPTAEWFRTLSSPYTRNCCDQSDCKLAEAEFRTDPVTKETPIDQLARSTGSWWAKSNRTNTWVQIGPEKITETVSMFAKAVLCEGEPALILEPLSHYVPRIYCFAPPPTGF